MREGLCDRIVLGFEVVVESAMRQQRRLHYLSDGDRFEAAARRAMTPNFPNAHPAERYAVVAR